jgi:Ca2+-binding EF-hand superfamily protein
LDIRWISSDHPHPHHQELKDLRNMFDMMDADGSGEVSLEELELAIDMAGE